MRQPKETANKGWLVIYPQGESVRAAALDMAILIKKIKAACKAHGNNTSVWLFVWIGFYPIKFSLCISVSNGVGVEALINQQPATLSELLCSFLRIGTGLEMEVKFMNFGLRMLLYARGRHKE